MDWFKVNKGNAIKSIVLSKYKVKRTTQEGWFRSKEIITEDNYEDSKAVFLNGRIYKTEVRSKGDSPLITTYLYNDILGLIKEENSKETRVKIVNRINDCEYSHYYSKYSNSGVSITNVFIKEYRWGNYRSDGKIKKRDCTILSASAIHSNTPSFENYMVNMQSSTSNVVNSIFNEIRRLESLMTYMEAGCTKELKDAVDYLRLYGPFYAPTNYPDCIKVFFPHLKPSSVTEEWIYDFDGNILQDGDGTYEYLNGILTKAKINNKTMDFICDNYGNWIECRCYDENGDYSELFTRQIKYIE
jgi:hypothetical protein